VIFLHGWGSTNANMYGPWIAHLARQGYFVIYPQYQVVNVTRPDQILAKALTGVRTGLRLARADHHAVAPGPVVVVGHSAGGMLAADYAAVAAAEHLPPARTVYSVYPGRKPIGGHWTSQVPLSDLSRIPAETELTVLAGATDTTAGEATARTIYAGASQVVQKQFVTVRTPVISDHIGPMYDYGPTHRTFWAPLDRLLTR
jgi:acetyl esterase/lipase